jgi:hypothetical protein
VKEHLYCLEASLSLCQARLAMATGASPPEETSSGGSVAFEAFDFFGERDDTDLSDGIDPTGPALYNFFALDPYKTGFEKSIKSGVQGAGTEGQPASGKFVHCGDDGVTVSWLVGQSGKDEEGRLLKHVIVIYRSPAYCK